MRLIGHVLLLVMALALVLAGASGALRWWQQAYQLQTGPARVSGLGDRVVFEPMPGQAVRFNVSTHQGWAVLRGLVVAARAARRENLPLTVDLEIVDGSGKRLAVERRFLELQSVEPLPAPYGLLAGAADAPMWLLPEEWIDLHARPGAREVRVRLADADPAISNVFWRASIDIRLGDDATKRRYERLGSQRREALTRDWVTPSSLIAPEAKQALLRHRLQPVGPLGLEGTDYRVRRVLREPAATRRRAYDEPFNAIVAGPDLRVSLRLPGPTPVSIQVLDRRAPAIGLWRISADGARPIADIEAARHELTLPAGLYELRAVRRVTVDVRDARNGRPLVPDGMRVQAFALGKSDAVSYRLFASGRRSAPLSLEFRPRGGVVNARVLMLDAAGETLRSQQIRVDWRPSLYERALDRPDRPSGVPLRVRIDPPAEARSLRIEADGNVLATAFVALSPDALAGRPAGQQWFSFLPEPSPGRMSARGIFVLQQPRFEQVALAAGPRARPPRAQMQDSGKPRPRLRLRPEADDHGGQDASE